MKTKKQRKKQKKNLRAQKRKLKKQNSQNKSVGFIKTSEYDFSSYQELNDFLTDDFLNNWISDKEVRECFYETIISNDELLYYKRKQFIEVLTQENKLADIEKDREDIIETTKAAFLEEDHNLILFQNEKTLRFFRLIEEEEENCSQAA